MLSEVFNPIRNAIYSRGSVVDFVKVPPANHNQEFIEFLESYGKYSIGRHTHTICMMKVKNHLIAGVCFYNTLNPHLVELSNDFN